MTSKYNKIFLFLVFLSFLVYGGVKFNHSTILNFEDPPKISGKWESPVELGHYIYHPNENSTATDNVRNLFVSNDTAYILIDVYGMVIVDVSNPTNPQYLGIYPEFSRNVNVINETAYLTSGNGFFVVNVSIPSSPTLLGENNAFTCSGLYVSGDLAYVGCRYYGMVIFNVSNPTTPEFVGEYLNASNQDYDDIYVVNNTAYVADYQGHNLKVINVSDPYNPKILGIYSYYSPNGGPNDVWVVEDICYLSIYDGGLKILNVSDPKNATTLFTYNSGGFYSGVCVSDDILYLSNYNTGIKVFNVSIPSNPVLLGSYDDIDDAAYSIFYDDSFLYAGWGEKGLKILDPGYDTDEDGIPDAFEKSFGLDYLDPSDAVEDPDNDNLNNFEEMQAGSEIYNPDTDGDGLLDGDEVKIYGTDPTDSDSDDDGVSDSDDSFPMDTDNDGLTNKEESETYSTDPFDDDSDDDSLSDGVEIRLGYDPNDWDTDGDGIGDGLEFIANFGGLSSGQALLDGFIRMTIQWEENFIIITTNSTMLSASFDTEKKKLTFDIEGVSEARGLCNISIPASLVGNIDDISVKLDGESISFNIDQDNNMIFLSFFYSHSEHSFSIYLSEDANGLSIPGVLLSWILGFLILGIISVILRISRDFKLKMKF